MVTLRPRLFSALHGRPVSIGLESLLRFRLAALLPIEDWSPLMMRWDASATWRGKLGLTNLEGDARSRTSTIEITPRSLVWRRRRRRGAASFNVCGIAWIVLAGTAHRALFSLRQFGVCSQLHSSRPARCKCRGMLPKPQTFTVRSTTGRKPQSPLHHLSVVAVR